MKNLNEHIEDYLNYYLYSDFNPGFAVLLQGKWGCGKTWFIREFIKGNDDSKKNKKFLYITLYGVCNVFEIEDQIFQQLHPVLSSKAMALSGKILKGIARASLKIDFDGDGKAEGSINSQIPDIKFPDYLKNTSQSILIFDDLERCSIPLKNLLGYINSFVEHQELKVILIANEEELECVDEKNLENKEYKRIKEKLIGKTFQVEQDIEKAYKYFISKINHKDAKNFLSDNKDEIIEIFNVADYCNLRHLKQILWDFERFYQSIPNKYREINDLMGVLLKHFFAFSFEIKSGSISFQDIKEMDTTYLLEYLRKDSEKPSPISLFIKKYSFINTNEMILTEKSWREFFEKGYLSESSLIESLEKSTFCQNDNTPLWVKLWRYIDLEDDEFNSLFSKVLKQWDDMEFTIPGEVLHICGLFIKFSYIGLIEVNKDDVLIKCEKYIDKLKNNGLFKKYHSKTISEFLENDEWGGLAYAGSNLEEFKYIYSFIIKKIHESEIESLPDVAKNLIEILKEDTDKFESMIFLTNSEESIYYKTPVFIYISPEDFFNVFKKLSNPKKKKLILAFKRRYQNNYIELLDEIHFLKCFEDLLNQEANANKGKVSGYFLSETVGVYLKKIIENIEKQKI